MTESDSLLTRVAEWIGENWWWEIVRPALLGGGIVWAMWMGTK